MTAHNVLYGILLICFCFIGCSDPIGTESDGSEIVDAGSTPEPEPELDTDTTRDETSIRYISLAGSLNNSLAEISGLTWYGDTLLMLPQYPDFGSGTSTGTNGVLYGLSRSDILSVVHGDTSEPQTAFEIPFSVEGSLDSIVGFQGYEACVVIGDVIYLTIESGLFGQGSNGYIISGTIAADLSSVVMDATTITELPAQNEFRNMGYEALTVVDGEIVAFSEVNGSVVEESMAYSLDASLSMVSSTQMGSLEYRLTDATAVDESNRFWVSNYFYPGERFLLPESDPLIELCGEGETHSRLDHVERLVEFQFSETGIFLTDTAPLFLELEDESRNWEGIARLDELGFLVVTDKYPTTLLGFVPVPE